MDQFIGEIRCFGFNFAPLDWLPCDGRTLAIGQFTTLYAVVGTIYGGDGVSTFQLPDLRGRAPMHWGHGPGGFNTAVGMPLGSSTETLTPSQIPQHFHTINAANLETGGAVEESAEPSTTGGSYMARAQGSFIYQPPPVTPDSEFAPTAISKSGNSQAHQNMQPLQVVNFFIATDGVFPARN
jgi:microcystin-dependent protein